MSLKVKFLILIAGSVITPLVVSFIAFGLSGDLPSLEVRIAQFKQYRLWRSAPLDLKLDEDALSEAFRDWPSSTSIRVYDESGTLLYAQGAEVGPDPAPSLQVVRSSPVTFNTGRRGKAVMARPADSSGDYHSFFFVPLAGLLFFAAMAVAIVQSINRSVAELERATSRIVAGDLDFDLRPRGNDKLASLTRSFDSMRRHLKEEYARRSRFLMGVSHDLRTPLSSISGYVAAIRDGLANTPEKLDRYTAIIGRKAALLEARLTTLIDYVMRDTAEWAATFRPVDVAAFFHDFARVLEIEASLEGRPLCARLEVPVGLMLSMDPDLVLRALENLAHNALEHSPPGTAVDFEVSAAGGEIRVAFANEGPGIPASDLDAVFEPFVRGSRNRAGSGLGLGLATVKSVVVTHGWHIEVASTPHERTVFTVRIPCKTA